MGFINVALVGALWFLMTIDFVSRDTAWDLAIVTFLVLIAQPLLLRRQASEKEVPMGCLLPLTILPLLGMYLQGCPIPHGRPLRIRGRSVKAGVRAGGDWTGIERPEATGVDEATRRALESLWLEDARAEHASVPAFARISWLLASVGAPPHLVEWSHRAALEEIGHARACFAMAAGYGGRAYDVQPMPEIARGGLEDPCDPVSALVVECAVDGCMIEDFNADVAEAACLACEEPVAKSVLSRIAREERSHAEFSWALLSWLRERYPEAARSAMGAALDALRSQTPPWLSADQRVLVRTADMDELRRRGRIDETSRRKLWEQRLEATLARLESEQELRFAA